MDIKRDYIVMTEFIPEDQIKWETVRRINKFDRDYLQYVVKKYCGKSLFGKVFRVAYLETNEGRKWILNDPNQ